MWAEFVDTKLMTRATYTLAGVNGPLEDKGGLTFTEKDGIDYAPATVQLPGGCLLYTSPSPRDATLSRMPSSA